jgi:hypothetical protein
MNHQDDLLPSKSSQPIDNNIAMVNPQESLKTNEKGPARKTQMLESPKALSISWIELFLKKWCAPVGEP